MGFFQRIQDTLLPLASGGKVKGSGPSVFAAPIGAMADAASNVVGALGLPGGSPVMGDLGDWQGQIGKRFTSGFDRQAQDAMAREAAQMEAARLGAAPSMDMATIATGPQGEMRGGQADMLAQLQARARGEMPSAAEISFGRAQEGNIRAARSAAMSAQGMNPATQARMAQQGMEGANIGAAGQLAQLRAQEQAAAEQSYLAGAGAVRGADIGLAARQAELQQQAAQTNVGLEGQYGMTQAGLQQDANAANLAAQQRQQEINQARAAHLEETGYARDYSKAELEQQAKIARSAGQVQQAVAKTGGKGALLSGVLGAAGSVIGGLAAGASDKRVKNDIRPANNEKIQEFLNSLKPQEYNYNKDYIDREASASASEAVEDQLAPGKEYFIGSDEQGWWASPSWGSQSLEKIRLGEGEEPAEAMRSYDQTEGVPWWQQAPQRAPPQDVYAGTGEEGRGFAGRTFAPSGPARPTREPQDVYAGTGEEGRGFAGRTFAPSGPPRDQMAMAAAARQQQLAGRRTGVMAQDIERSEIGQGMVSKDETGTRRIEPDAGTLMAALGQMNQRLSNFEAGESKPESKKEKAAKRKARFLERMKAKKGGRI